MRRVLERMYGVFPKNAGQAHAFALQRFGQNAGIAQQYLFHYARMHGVG